VLGGAFENTNKLFYYLFTIFPRGASGKFPELGTTRNLLLALGKKKCNDWRQDQRFLKIPMRM
jgi:hypothetical protein